MKTHVSWLVRALAAHISCHDLQRLTAIPAFGS
jgi:hypothetical protein